MTKKLLRRNVCGMNTTLITTAEAAAKLGLTVRAIQKMIEAGRLEAQKVGRDYLIDPNALGDIPKQAAGRPPNAASAKKRATGEARVNNGTSTGKKKGKSR